ncbi:hypothetical protein [Brucella sp. BZ]|uniref:hypothetical protein n=1 Tax=Brucella sp. BZ TaxID=3381346 RepID=UPI0039E73F3C
MTSDNPFRLPPNAVLREITKMEIYRLSRRQLLPTSFIGYAVSIDGRDVAAWAAYAYAGDMWLSARFEDGIAKRHQVTVHRAALLFLAGLKAHGFKLKAWPDPEIPRSREWLQRLGFTEINSHLWEM